MQDSRLFRIIYRSLWAVLIIAFVAIGVREVSMGAEGRFISAGPSASTDAYLKTLLGILEPSKICTERIGRLRSKNPILFLCPPRDAESDFIYYALAYLTWPRQIKRITVEPDGLTNMISSLDRTRTDVIFCRFQDLAEFRTGWRVGPNLLIVPMTATE